MFFFLVHHRGIFWEDTTTNKTIPLWCKREIKYTNFSYIYIFFNVFFLYFVVWHVFTLSHLKPPVVFIVLDHIHEIASQCFQEIGRVSLWLDLQFGTQAGGREARRWRWTEKRYRRNRWENETKLEHILVNVKCIITVFSCALRIMFRCYEISTDYNSCIICQSVMRCSACSNFPDVWTIMSVRGSVALK